MFRVLRRCFFGRLGQEFVPTLGREGHLYSAYAYSEHKLDSIDRNAIQGRKALLRFPEVSLVYSKTGTAEMASDPMPPNVSDTFVILKPQAQWPNPGEPKDSLIQRIEIALKELPGANYEFTQPIQMRFNELIAGVRSDLAIKVYGDKFEEMARTAQSIARVVEKIPGATDVKVEQAQGLPAIDIAIDRAALSRHGLSVADVQEIAAIGVGGRQAGLVFEGDRRFDIVVRLSESLRNDVSAIENLPVPLPARSDSELYPKWNSMDNGTNKADKRNFLPLKEVATVRLTEGVNQVSRGERQASNCGPGKC